MHTVDTGIGMQFQWCAGIPTTQVDGRTIALPRKALGLLAYLCLEAGPHSRSQLSALLWPESDETHASMSLRQALSKLRDVVGDALIADRQHVSLQREAMPLADICDVHRFEAQLARDPLTACRTDVHRFLDALDVDDAPDFVHWCDRTRARLMHRAVQALRRTADDCYAQRDWPRLRAVSERWLTIDPLSVDGACGAIEAAFLTRDVVGALAYRDTVQAALVREELADDDTMSRVRAVVEKYQKLGQTPTPSGARAMVAPAASATPAVDWHSGPLRERQDAWSAITTAVEGVQREQQAQWVTLSGGIGSGRSRVLHDALLLCVQRGAIVMTIAHGARVASPAFAAVAALVRSVINHDALAGLDEHTLRLLAVLVPELTDVYPALRRSALTNDSGESAFAVRLQDALTQMIAVLAEEGPVVIGLDEAMSYDRESAVALQAVTQRVQSLPVLVLATDADDEVQVRENGEWAAAVQGGTRLTLSPLTTAAIEQQLIDATGVETGWRPLAERIHAASHGMPGASIEVLLRLDEQWGPPALHWQLRSLSEVPVPRCAPRLRAHIDELDATARTLLLSLAVVMEDGHPIPITEWSARPVLNLDALSHIHGISRLRAAVLGAQLVERRLAVEDGGGFRCASPVVAQYVLANGSALVRDELRRLIQMQLAGNMRV